MSGVTKMKLKKKKVKAFQQKIKIFRASTGVLAIQSPVVSCSCTIDAPER